MVVNLGIIGDSESMPKVFKPCMLIPRVFDDPRSCQMDGHMISTHKGS